MGVFTGKYDLGRSGTRSASRWHCYAKRRLSDPNWVYLPFLTCNYMEQSAAPSIGSAEFEAHYGLQMKGSHNLNYWDFYYPFQLNGAYILVAGQNSFSNYGPVQALGIYQIMNERVTQYSNDEYPTGNQIFNGVELSIILDRLYISFSVVVNKEGEYLYIPDAKIFNENLISSNNSTGNMSNSRYDGGAYYFDEEPNNGQTAWSNYDILEYVLYWFVNSNIESLNSIEWELDGDGLGVLRGIYSKIDINGKTVFQILDEIISKNFGLGFTVDFNFLTGRPVIKVFSRFPSGVFSNSTRGVYRQVQLDNEGVIVNRLEFDEGSIYDRIHVIGGPIYTTATWSLYNNNLDINWNENLEEEYLTIDTYYPETSLEEMDEERSKTKYAKVYNSFKVPDTWNGVGFSTTLPGDVSGVTTQTYPLGLNYFPKVDPYSGFLDFTYSFTPYYYGRSFEAKLPFEDENNENRDAFVGIGIYKSDIDNLSRADIKYFDITDLGNIELPSGDLTFDNNTLAFTTNVNPAYSLAKDIISIDDSSSGAHWAKDPMVPINMELIDGEKIKANYENIFLTATVNTGNKINLMRNASTSYETLRVKTINMGDSFNLHFVANQTISEIIPSENEENYNDIVFNQNAYIYKNDIDKLRNIMNLALSIYSTPRAVCDFAVADPLYNWSVGDYIISDISRFTLTYINQNVTTIRRTLTNSGINTEVLTSFDEIDFGVVYDNMLDYKYKKFRPDFARGATEWRRIITPKKGQSPGKDIIMVSDFPELPTSKTKYIYLKNSEVDPLNEQIWEGVPGDNRWRPTVKHCTLNGFPNEIADMS